MAKDTKRRSCRPNFAGALLSAVALCGGCSLLLHADPSQCSSDTDCTARGPAFANHQCRSGTCVAPEAIDAATDARAEAGGSEAGDAIQMAGCAKNADCQSTSTTHPEVACDIAAHACVQLTTDECPFVLPTDYASQPAPPVFIGAFATLPPNSSTSHPSYLNYKLALDEFKIARGIPAGPATDPGAGLRTPVAIVCNVAADIHTAMTHLQSDLHAAGVVAPFDSGTLKTMFTMDALPGNTFVVNPFGANTDLTTLTTKGLLWHMLGQPSDDAAAYAGFFPRMESYVRNLLGLSAATPLRVATVTANAIDTQNLYTAVTNVIQWNGQPFAKNGANFLNVAIDSVLGGVDPHTIDPSNAIAALGAFKPHVIVSFAATEFVVDVLSVYETNLQPGSTSAYASNPKPFYLLGPYNMDSQDLLGWIGNGTGAPTEARRMRVAGIGVAAASDAHELNAYQSRFLAAGNPATALGQENYYDAMYFLVYSIVGAGRAPTLHGTNLYQGMLRLIDSSGTSYDMGPAAAGGIFGALGANGTISLFGALGAPDFTIATGARVGEGSTYCVQRNMDANHTPSYAYDVLRLNGKNDAGAPTLGGNFSCYSASCGDGGTCP